MVKVVEVPLTRYTLEIKDEPVLTIEAGREPAVKVTGTDAVRARIREEACLLAMEGFTDEADIVRVDLGRALEEYASSR